MTSADQGSLFEDISGAAPSSARASGSSAVKPALAKASAVAKATSDTMADKTPDRPSFQPLAARMRPRALGEIVGQDHLLKPGSLLPRLIATNRFGSIIFYGPPGSGKTSFAEV